EKKRILCPLLEDSACQVYEARPVICRTHGFALHYQQDGQALLGWCELNFTEQQPTEDLAFNIEHLSVLLSTMTRLGWPGEDARIPLVTLLQKALHAPDKSTRPAHEDTPSTTSPNKKTVSLPQKESVVTQVYKHDGSSPKIEVSPMSPAPCSNT
ncbi:MAG: hypothetical protein AAGJ35_09555, partial [Myxococcota bacterium]